MAARRFDASSASLDHVFHPPQAQRSFLPRGTQAFCYLAIWQFGNSVILTGSRLVISEKTIATPPPRLASQTLPV